MGRREILRVGGTFEIAEQEGTFYETVTPEAPSITAVTMWEGTSVLLQYSVNRANANFWALCPAYCLIDGSVPCLPTQEC